MSAELRALIRDVLREELATMRPREAAAPQVRHEPVAINSDADLAAFVRRILALGADSRARAGIEAGREPHERPPARTGGAAAAPVSYERGLVTEREVRNLPEGATQLRIGKNVRLTPLAQDELRRRGVKIERTRS